MDLFSKFRNREQAPPPQNRKQGLFRDFDVIYVFVAFMLVYVLLFRVVVVTGDSMNQTLLDGDMLLLASNTIYHNPRQGDIIVASKDSFRDGECIVKRVIATEGQLVDIDFERRIVYVDGQEKGRIGPFSHSHVVETWLPNRIRVTVSFSRVFSYIAHVSFSDDTASREV